MSNAHKGFYGLPRMAGKTYGTSMIDSLMEAGAKMREIREPKIRSLAYFCGMDYRHRAFNQVAISNGKYLIFESIKDYCSDKVSYRRVMVTDSINVAAAAFKYHVLGVGMHIANKGRWDIPQEISKHDDHIERLKWHQQIMSSYGNIMVGDDPIVKKPTA